MKYFVILLLLFCGTAHGAIYIDNNTSGCSNGATNYSPSTRSCGSGSDTVYTTWANAVSGVSAGSEGSPTVINIRSGTEYDVDRITINKAWTTWQKYSGDSSKPVVDGENAATLTYASIIYITVSGVTIDGIELKNGYTGAYDNDPQRRRGIFIGETPNAACTSSMADISDTIIKNCYIHDMGGSAIRAHNAYETLIENNEFYECEKADLEGMATYGWAGVVHAFCRSNDTIIRGNYFHENGGEGINLYRSRNGEGARILIEDNIFGDNTNHPTIFNANSEEVIIRNNVVYGTNADRYTSDARLISVASEHLVLGPDSYDDPTNVYIYGNMTAGGSVGAAVSGIYEDKTAENIWIFNNTIIEPFNDTWRYTNSGIAVQENRATAPINIFNNIVWSTLGTPMYEPKTEGDADPTFGYNLWSNTPASEAQESTDPRYPNYGAMSISQYFQKQSGWTSLNVGSLSSSDFKLRSSAAYAIDTGRAPLTISSIAGNNITFTENGAYMFWPNDTIYDDDGNSTTVTAIVDEDTLTVSSATGFTGGDGVAPFSFGGTTWDIGASEYGGTPQNVLPTVSINSPSGPQTIAVDGSVSFTCTATDSDGSIASYLWTFDDSGISNSTSEDPGSQTFTVEGNYTVIITVTDNSGGQASDSVEIQVGTPAAPTPYYEWDMEAANVVLDDQGNDNLINNGSITTGGTEPDPPGYGSVGAVLDDATPQYFSLANASIGNAVCNGTDTDCTIIIAFRADDLQTDYLYSIYQASTGERQLAFGLFSGTPNFLWGYNDGDSYQNITISNTFTAAEDIIIGLSLNASTKTFTFLAQDVATGEYFQRTNSDTALTGTYNTGSSSLTIGIRSDGSADRALDGTIYWVRVYDDALSRSEMETVFENTTAVGDIERCFVTEQKTFTTDDTVTVRCDLSSSTTVDKTGGTPYIELETGGTDLQCSLDTGNGSGVEQLEFSGTVLAGMTASLINVTANGIQLNGGSLGGIDDTVATSGPGSIGYESQASIDTSAIGSATTMDACDSDGNEITTNTLWVRAEYGNLKVCWGESAYFNSGPIEDIVIPFTITAGSPIDFKYAGTQPSGMGISEACWLFEALIESDMEEKVNVTMDAVSDTTHGSTIIQDIEGTEITFYHMPQVEVDDTYEVRIKGTPGFIFKAE
jgi:hypothetical protein